MKKRMFIVVALVLLVVAGLAAKKYHDIHKMIGMMAAMGGVPQTVSTTTAVIDDWQPQLHAVGSLRAVNGADLSLEVSGVVDEIDFKSGSDVQQGAVLLHLRAQDDIAKLQSLQATAQLAQIVYARDQKQFEAKAVAQATLDADEANLKNDRAQVNEQQAIVEKKTLRAPFSGHLGIRAVDLGQYLNAGTAIVTLQSLDPIYVDFYLPQQSYSLIKDGQKVAVSVDAYPGAQFDGTITAINPVVESGSRNLRVRATVANPDRKLLPGMYATVNIDSGEAKKLVTLPQTAITYNSYGNTVFLIDASAKDDKGQQKLVARQSFVVTGDTRGDQIAVLSGVKQGDTVVTAGQIKLRNGSAVSVNNNVEPTNEANPTPTAETE